MQFFTHISSEFTCKNNLYKEILAFLYLNDRKIVPQEFIEHFKKGIIKGIEDINKKNPRCKPIKATWNGWCPHKEKDYRLDLGYSTICTFNIYQAN
jgi:hypothetical protein